MTARLRRFAAARALLDSPVRHVAQNAAMALGPLRRLAMRGHRTGIGDDHEAAARVVADLVRLTAAAGGSVRGAHVLELGPGRSPHVLAAALALGARTAFGADTQAYLRRPDPLDVGTLVDALSRIGLDVVARPDITSNRYGVHVYDGRALPLPASSVDLVWSHSVLEHVRDPGAVLREVRRVLRPDGLVVSVVDLRDHLRLGAGQDHLHMLRRSDMLFDLMMSHRSSWVNRLRASEWSDLARRSGFDVVIDERAQEPLPAGFTRDALHDRFRGWDDDELRVSWWRSVLRPVAR